MTTHCGNGHIGQIPLPVLDLRPSLPYPMFYRYAGAWPYFLVSQMIGMSSQNGESTIELFEQKDARQFMSDRHLPKR
jgi:hypothetical protein